MKISKMLDIRGQSVLPKNMNGVRTTHTCELCGFEPKTKNKYREKQDHLVMKHFKEKIDKIFPHCRPYSCPTAGCEFTGKDKQALLRHYTGKHGILEKYLKEALADKGISYVPGDHGGKRKNGEHGNSKAKKAMLVKPPTTTTIDAKCMLPTAPIPLAVTPVSTNGVIANGLTGGGGPQLNGKGTTTTRSNNEELRKEVEAMMASFQPQPQQSNGCTPNGTTVTNATPTAVVNGNSKQVVLSLPNVPVSLEDTQKVQKTVTLPARVQLPTQPTIVTTTTNGSSCGNGLQLSNSQPPSSVVNLVRRSEYSGEVVTKNGHTIIVTNGTNTPQHHQQQPTSRPPAAVLNGCSNGTLPELILPSTQAGELNGIPIEVITTSANGGQSGETRILENEEVMWGGGGAIGPAVVVEAAHTVPVAYIEGSEIVYSAANLDIDYDYLNIATTVAGGMPTAIAAGDGINGKAMERQLEFSML